MYRPWELVLEVSTGDLLGEGVIWDDREGVFFWTDILGKRLHRYDLAAAQLTTVPLHARLCSFGLTSNAGILIAAFDKEIGWLESATGRFNPAMTLTFPKGVRLNDGRVGPDGAFWVGSMVEDPAVAGADDLGQLFRFAPGGQLTTHLDGICISNGLCWAPQGERLYHADSVRGKVSAYSFDQSTGRLGKGKPFITPAAGASPDGAVTDLDGRYYSALWGQGCIGVYSREGVAEGRIGLPASQVSCVVFGGVNLDLLAVTTARVDLTDDELARQPSAGSLLVYQTRNRGLPERRFAGSVPALGRSGQT